MSSLETRIASLQDELAAVRAQVRALESKEAIATVLRDVARALDRLDRELLAQQFTQDAYVDYGRIYQGPAAGFIEAAMQFQGAMRATQHFVANIQIELADDQAVAETYVHAHHTMGEGDDVHELIVGGRYLDRFVRRDGRWRILFRTEVLDWGKRAPIPDRWFEDNQELPKGVRDRTDRAYEFLHDAAHDVA